MKHVPVIEKFPSLGTAGGRCGSPSRSLATTPLLMNRLGGARGLSAGATDLAAE